MLARGGRSRLSERCVSRTQRMIWLVTAVFVVLGALAFRPSRWAYFTFVALGVLFFPARVGFHFHPQPCECALSVPLALFSLTNYGHLVPFTIFFLMPST